MKGIADTGFLVAFLNRRDLHHRWACSVAETVEEPLLTCEAVLAEAAFHVGSAESVLKLVETGLIRVEFEMNRHLQRIAALARRYRDRQPDLADLCLICRRCRRPTPEWREGKPVPGTPCTPRRPAAEAPDP
jgi:predicted nucleic acid-binding protein